VLSGHMQFELHSSPRLYLIGILKILNKGILGNKLTIHFVEGLPETVDFRIQRTKLQRNQGNLRVR